MTEPAYLLDTNVCIAVLDGNNEPVRRRLQTCLSGAVVTSAIVLAEVLIGARQRDAVASARAFFQLVPALPFGPEQGEMYARLPFKRGNLDRLIAAHALSLDLTLVTANERDFADIPDLRVENWTR